MIEIDKQILSILDLLITIGLVDSDIEFAKELGLTKQGMSNIRNGRASFTVKHISALKDKFKINIAYLFNQSQELFYQKKSNKKSNILNKIQ